MSDDAEKDDTTDASNVENKLVTKYDSPRSNELMENIDETTENNTSK